VCGEWHDSQHFYKSSRHKCKSCYRTEVSLNQEKNSEYYRIYYQNRDAFEHRKQLRADYNRTEKGKVSKKGVNERYAKANPHKRAAHRAVDGAIRAGKLAPWPCCALPDCGKVPQAHHPDYDQPLDVIWLCPQHHHDAHDLVSSRNLSRTPLGADPRIGPL
jgi:hypothetical protein